MEKKAEKYEKRQEKANKRANRVLMKQKVNELKQEKAAVKVCKILLLYMFTIFIFARPSETYAKLDAPSSPTK